jgi:hypothetical protein
MRKWMVVLAVLAVAPMISSKNANAQTSLSFGNGTSSENVTFIANGGSTGATLDIGTCTTTCTLTGSNTGGGGYSFVTTGPLTVGILGSGGGLSDSVSGGTSVFSYTNGSSGLIGNVTWTSLITDGDATVTGILTITSSSLTGPLGVVGQTAKIDFTTNPYTTDLSTLFAGSAGGSEGATLSSGELVATPEPSSMLLFGTGLLLFGGILRKRLA